MRVTIAHHRTKQEVKDAVDQTFNDLFQGVAGIPVQITVQQRSWQGDVLTFALNAKMAALSAPIKGTVEVTDTDLTMDVDLGILGHLIPEKKVSEVLGNRIKGLLK